MPASTRESGVMLELKVLDTCRNERVEHAPEAAVEQLKDRDYAAGPEAAGAGPIYQWGVVFDGKRAWVRPVDKE